MPRMYCKSLCNSPTIRLTPFLSAPCCGRIGMLQQRRRWELKGWGRHRKRQLPRAHRCVHLLCQTSSTNLFLRNTVSLILYKLTFLVDFFYNWEGYMAELYSSVGCCFGGGGEGVTTSYQYTTITTIRYYTTK